MKNLARATATAGLAIAFGIIATPSASAAVHEATGATKAKSSASSAASKKAAAKKAATKKAAAKAASAALANRPVTINVYYVMHDGRVISEQGPGDSAAHEVEGNSGAIDMQSQNESIRTGDLRAEGKNSNSPVTFEVEGSEQDQGEAS
jgi:hypothetical protein